MVSFLWIPFLVLLQAADTTGLTLLSPSRYGFHHRPGDTLAQHAAFSKLQQNYHQVQRKRGRQHQLERARQQQSRTRSCLQLFRVSTPLVDATDLWGNTAVLLGTAAASQVLGETTAIGRLLGPPVSAMAMAFVLATVGVLQAGGTTAAQSLQWLALQLATPLILLGGASHLQSAASRCGPLILSFLLASLATLLACVVGWKVAGSSLLAALGRDGLVVASALLAKNIGGGINYIAVCTSLQASPMAVAAGLCVDNLFALVYFPATSALAQGLPDVDAADMVATNKSGDKDGNDSSSSSSSAPTMTVTVQSVSNVLCLAAALLWLGDKLGGGLPACTLLTVLVATLAPRQWLTNMQPAADCLGTVALYVFFATAGAPGLAVADSVRAAMLPLSAFLTCLYSIHGLMLYLLHKLLFQHERYHHPCLEPQRLLVASSAAIGGPATATALAHASKWESLKIPSLIVGNIGYAIATFLGLAYFTVLSGALVA